MNTDKLTINWQTFAGVRLQLNFAFIIRSCVIVNPDENFLTLLKFDFFEFSNFSGWLLEYEPQDSMPTYCRNK